MILNPNNISFSDFLAKISGLAEIEQHTILINYDHEIKGTIHELKKLANEIDNLELKRFIHELNNEYKREYSNIEILNYLAELTNDFETERVKVALFEMEVFENMELEETFNELASLQYHNNNWEVPTYKAFNPILKRMDSFEDYKKMRKRVFPFAFLSFYFAMGFLKNSLKKEAESKKNEFKIKSSPTKDNRKYNLSNKDLEDLQNNLIPKIKITDVYNHFNVLTKTTNKNNEFYLTQEQLLIFIKSVFIDKKPIKQDFNCQGITKKTVRKIFYNFYFYNRKVESNQTKIKRKYFNILNQAFHGFNENDYTDFAK
ncbi:hypothetical protein ES676_01330 [Bizionia saleffrena]|uniref:Uncharacterized protein n=1 Tax=Bizionia saleffrena TaxID=291189 RepID=A0A8H2LJD7_9FLAO|nr:hypothetical protein [Bizionia saleffrena]TYB80337.1 hypothetical protein ES676_01330 [Bizionia saleffrena]